MHTLKTSFAGIELKNPIIIGSCGRTNDAANIKAFEDAGAAAVVLKSLFEENITRQTTSMTDISAHSEEADYLRSYLRSEMLHEYIELIRSAKLLCSIPVIASINCFTEGEWTEFAAAIEQAGADALELNVMSIRTSVNYTDGDFERLHIDIIKSVRQRIGIPVIVKLGSGLTNPVSLISKLHAYGAAGTVLFNRLYRPDIDIEKMEYTSGGVFGTSEELSASLRWTGLASAAVRQMSFALSGGVLSGDDVVKAILAGASAVEVCSAVYRSGTEWIASASARISEWQARHGFGSPSEYCGRMNARDTENAERLERTQFLKYFEVHK